MAVNTQDLHRHEPIRRRHSRALSFVGWCFGLFASIAISGCATDPFGIAETESAKKQYEKRLAQTVPSFMTLETMFPDPSVRRLAKAAGKGDLKTVRRLVAEGVDVNARGTSNTTPLFWAMSSEAGFIELLKLGADPNVLIGDGNNLVLWATRVGKRELVRATLAHGGNPNQAYGDSGDTPLHEALHDEEIVDMLLAAGADIDHPNSFGSTPIISAASGQDFESVYLLLVRGADYKVENNSGRDVRDILAQTGAGISRYSSMGRWYTKVAAWFHERGLPIRDRFPR